LGIGTSTPNWNLQVSGTRPSLALSDYSAAANQKHWLLSSMGGNLYIGTSSDSFATSTIPSFMISPDGNVGIGTSSPNYALDINGSAGIGAGNEVMRVDSSGNVGIGTTSPYAKLSLVGTSGSLYDIFAISTSTSGLIFRVDSYGRTYGDSAYTAGADYAEYFKTDSVGLEPGETVCVDILNENAVKRCERGADNNVMGIVSSRPSVIGNNTKAIQADPAHYTIIGMLGQVDALVSAENGPINIGDSLTSASSTPGYAMRSDAGDSTVAVALESLTSGQGKIKVLISRRNKSLAVEDVEALVVERIANMKIEDQVQAMIKQSVDNLNLDPKITKIANEEANRLDAALTVALSDASGQIDYLRDQLINFQFSLDKQVQAISNFQTIFNEQISQLYTQIASTTALGENLKIDENGKIVIGMSSGVEIVNPAEIIASSTQTALVVNQAGEGDIADFQTNGVSIMNINNSGQVKIVGSLLVDGRIMICSGGFCSDALDSATDETMADLGVEGKVVAGAFEGYCDDGYSWVPGSAKYGTLPGFCVMNDLAGVNISQGEAIVNCQNLGAGYHLISENEWLTMAENILGVTDNNLIASTSLKFTNDNVINSLTGEVSEWTNRTMSATAGVKPASRDWQEYSQVDLRDFDFSPPYYKTSADGIGKILTGELANGLIGFVRGFGGIYGLDLSHAPSEQSESIGFRCAK